MPTLFDFVAMLVWGLLGAGCTLGLPLLVCAWALMRTPTPPRKTSKLGSKWTEHNEERFRHNA